MANELITKELDFSVEFHPSKISVAHKEDLEKAIETYSSKYKNLVITAENLEESKKVKAELNKVLSGLDAKRKDVKKEYSLPLNEFESWMKNLNSKIKEVIMPIDEGIKALDELERQKRIEVLNQTISEMAPKYDVQVDDISVQASWSNKTAFTAKGSINRKTLKEIADQMTKIKQEKDQLAANKMMISNYAQVVGLEPESWVAQVEDGSSPQELMKKIDAAVKAKNERLEAEKRRKEYKEAISSIEPPKTIEVSNKIVDEETGEIYSEDDLPDFSDEDPFPIFSEPIRTIEVRTYEISGLTNQIIDGINKLIDMGLIVKQVG